MDFLFPQRMARVESSHLFRGVAVQVSYCVGEAGPRFCCPPTHISRDPETGDLMSASAE